LQVRKIRNFLKRHWPHGKSLVRFLKVQRTRNLSKIQDSKRKLIMATTLMEMENSMELSVKTEEALVVTFLSRIARSKKVSSSMIRSQVMDV